MHRLQKNYIEIEKDLASSIIYCSENKNYSKKSSFLSFEYTVGEK
jgi:hypothetical protein